jgi:hypothetical protein
MVLCGVGLVSTVTGAATVPGAVVAGLSCTNAGFDYANTYAEITGEGDVVFYFVTTLAGDAGIIVDAARGAGNANLASVAAQTALETALVLAEGAEERANALDHARQRMIVHPIEPVARDTDTGPDNAPPAIVAGQMSCGSVVSPGTLCTLSCVAVDPDGDPVVYAWTGGARALDQNAGRALWSAPTTEGRYPVHCSVADLRGGTADHTFEFQVSHHPDTPSAQSHPLFLDLDIPGIAVPGDTAWFAGSVIDTRGLSTIHMLVMRPDGRKIIPFVDSVGGSTVVDLRRYYFATTSTLYAGVHGSYRVELTARNSEGHERVAAFDVELLPAMIPEPVFDGVAFPEQVGPGTTTCFTGAIIDSMPITAVTIDVYGRNGWARRAYADSGLSAKSVDLSAICLPPQAFDASSDGLYRLRLTASNSFGVSTTHYFSTEVTVNRDSVPQVCTPDPASPPVLNDVTLASTLTFPHWAHFGGVATDSDGIVNVAMWVSGPAGNHTAFRNDTLTESLDLSIYSFRPDNRDYAGKNGTYIIMLTLTDNTGATTTADFTITVHGVPEPDTLPRFLSTSLPPSVSHPQWVYFAGTAEDDKGITNVTMVVAGPAGTETAFSHDTLAPAIDLSIFTFRSDHPTYANRTGKYTVTLRITDTAEQTAHRTFAITVY